jgi:hypothetical protein
MGFRAVPHDIPRREIHDADVPVSRTTLLPCNGGTSVVYDPDDATFQTLCWDIAPYKEQG